MLLAQGTGAKWAQVWLNVSGRLTLAATWPADVDADRTPPSLRPEDIVVPDEGLRALPVQPRRTAAGGAPAPGAPRPGPHPRRGAALRRAGRPSRPGAEVGRAPSRARRPSRGAAGPLRARSKPLGERLIETQDAERSRLERDLHDGAQQHLVALTVNLRLAHTIVERSPHRAAAVLVRAGGRGACRDRDAVRPCPAGSTRGSWPTRASAPRCGPLSRAARCRSPSTPTAWHDSQHRSRPRSTSVAWRRCRTPPSTPEPARCRCEWTRTRTDGSSPSPTTAPASTRPTAPRRPEPGLANMRDRLDAVGGTVEVMSSERTGTTVTAVVPRTDVAVTPRDLPLPARCV